MRFAILSFKKLHTLENVRECGWHIFREALDKTTNADPSRQGLNENPGPTTSSEEMVKLVEDRVSRFRNRTGKNKGQLRKNALHAVEVVVTTSPEWFKNPEFRNSGGTGAEYFVAAQAWLETKFGPGNLVACTVHRDETTPHMHCVYVPIRERGGKLRLDGWAMLGDHSKLSRTQTEFAEEVGSQFDLVRGIEKSGAKHEDIKRFYGMMKTPTTSMSGEEFKLIVKKAILYDKDRKRREPRDRALSEMRERSTRLREIPLRDILDKAGIDPDPRDRNNYRTPVGRITVSGRKFHNHTTGKGGGGAIDLAKMLNDCDFNEAVNWLASAFGEGPVCEELAVATRQKVTQIAKEPPIDPIKIHMPEPTKWGKVRSYLVKTRGISGKVVDHLHKLKKVWADRFENCVFPLIDPNTKADVGVYLRGTRDEPFHGVRGKKGVYTIPAPRDSRACPELGVPEQIAVVEAPIDAISIQEMGFDGDAVATCGQPSREVSAWLQAVSKIKALFVAFDNDPAGDAMAAGLGVGTRYRPHSKDWSEDLKIKLDTCAGTSGVGKSSPSGRDSSGSLADGM